MSTRRLAASSRISALLLATLSAACGGGSSPAPAAPQAQNPAPSIQSLSPSTASAGANAFTLTVNGSNFINSTVIRWNASDRTTTFMSSSQVTATISAADLNAAGSVQVAALNPLPGGGQASAIFTVGPPPAPTVQSITPASVAPGSGAFSLEVTGSNFVSASVVFWNGTARPTTYVSNTRLTATISATDVATGGQVQVSVMTPQPGGGTSPGVMLPVQYAIPALTSLAPASAQIGSPGFTLAVNGNNFVLGATIFWNGISQVTQFVNPTQVTAALPAAALNLPVGMLIPVTVQNPTPTPGLSQTLFFSVTNPQPLINSISPGSAISGAGGTLTVTGSGFVSGAVVAIDGTNQSTTFVHSSTLTINIPLGLTVGNHTVTATNPSPGGGTSNGQTLRVDPAGQGAELTIVSISPAGTVVSGSTDPAVTSGGRYVSFYNSVRDTCIGAPAGCVPATVSAALAPVGPTTGIYFVSRLTDNGRYISFQQQSGLSTNPIFDLELADTCIGASGCTAATAVIVPKTAHTSLGSVSAEGRYLSFSSDDPSLPGANSTRQVYVQDTCISAAPGCSPVIFLVNGTTQSSFPQVNSSASGRYVTFLKDSDPNNSGTIAYLDTCLGAAPGCVPAQQSVSPTGLCTEPSISSDGRYLAYRCFVAPGNSISNIFLRDTCTGSILPCVPSSIQVTNGNAHSYRPKISTGGRFVTFGSSASNLLATDIGSVEKVFVYDGCLGGPLGCMPRTALVSLSPAGDMPNAECLVGAMSPDGTYISFVSSATNLGLGGSGVTHIQYLARNPLN